jgi:hypothetical protein
MVGDSYPVSQSLVDRVTSTISSSVDAAVRNRWEVAQTRSATLKGTTPQRLREVRRVITRELVTVGTVSGGVAAEPGFGTLTHAATTIAELGLITTRLIDLIFTTAIIHGHSRASVEERTAWIFVILAYGDGAGEFFTKLASEAGKGLGSKATARISAEELRRFNRTMGRTIVTKYGKKRGAVAIGEFFPFGVGAAIGGAGNYLIVRAIARQSSKFFAQLPDQEDSDGLGEE